MKNCLSVCPILLIRPPQEAVGWVCFNKKTLRSQTLPMDSYIRSPCFTRSTRDPIAGWNLLNYPPSFLFRYLENLKDLQEILFIYLR